MAWTKNTTDTLVSGNNVISNTGMTKYKFNQILTNITGASGSTDFTGRVGDGSFDSGTSYSCRESQNGSQSARVSGTFFNQGLTGYGSSNAPSLHIVYGINIAGEEKLFMEFTILQNTAGAGNVPNRYSNFNKWINTSVQYDQFEFIDAAGQTYDTDTNLSALGSEGVEELNVQDGAVYYDKTLNKEYVLNSNTWTEV
tara:strand:+ start:559 stop:1152 length:594 start_codon:yes stop_codon:yes gene_type:complete